MANFIGGGRADRKPHTLRENTRRNVGNGDTVRRNSGVQPQGNRIDHSGFRMGGPIRPDGKRR